ncbi:MAG: hypothetical protein P2A85_08410 [Microcoleus anatoxicus]|uniref:hypothetical protein n=1 Tax=Microcoleus anatoxicus TaxID=2705319 RepID=UPI0036732EF8
MFNNDFVTFGQLSVDRTIVDLESGGRSTGDDTIAIGTDSDRAILNDSNKFVGVVPRVPTPYVSGNHGE